MTYLLLKALHISAVVTWIGGMVTVAVSLHSPGDRRHLNGVRQWDRCVTTPMMVIAWGAGMALASRSHWFTQTWLMLKVTLVLLLSAVHGMLLGRLRRAIHSDHSDAIKHSPGWAGSILVLSFIVIFLVLTKPLAA